VYIYIYIYIYGSMNSVYYVQGSFTGVLLVISHVIIAGEVIYLYIIPCMHQIIRINYDQEFSFLGTQLSNLS
jgi:type IV secretory pathway VirB3-like protein